MLRITCTAFGPPEDLVLEEVPEPEPGPGQVAVRVEAAGVNYVDALIASGGYQIRPPLPYTPGSEFVGVVVAHGEGVTTPAVGTRVLSTGLSGGMAEVAVVPAALTWTVPDGLDPAVAATIAQSYCTMRFAFTRRDPLTPGEWVLVLGAGGGLGLAAVDLARAAGARVVAAASSADKLAAAVAAGAEATIDYSSGDLKTLARDLTGGGADVVVDPVGGDYSEAAFRSLRWGGRHLVLGFANGAIPRLPLNLALLNNRSVIGVDWGAWMARSRDEQRALLAEVLTLAASGALRPVRPTVRPLAEAPAVLRAFLERSVSGKVALAPHR